MSAEFTRDHCKITVAKILQTIGWHSINTTPLEVLTDILSNYIKELARTSKEYANEFGQTEPNLDHLGLAFEEMGVNLQELEEYTTYVNFVPPANPVPKYPLPKESNLNFLKPGSKEVVTRPVHINEHLPPMYPLLEEQNEPLGDNSTDKKEILDNDFDQFKKPAEVGTPEFKRIKREEESGRPTREISSVMMTTSGFLSPAREGRLPEAKAPAPPPEPPKPPSPIPVPELVPVLKKKPEKKRERPGKELFKQEPQEKIPKKANNMKDVLSIKRAKAMAANAAMLSPVMSGLQPLPPHFMSPVFPGDIKMPPLVPHKPQPAKSSNFNKALAAAKAKTEKLNTTITPIHIKAEPKFQPVDKLITEPDKKKINILRKISNVKHEKLKPNPAQQLIQQAQDIVNKINLSSDITIEPINPMSMHHNPIKMESSSYFDHHGSPPGTPPTPRTPEILAQSPPFKEKRKRKEKPEKPRVRKPRKQIQIPQPHFLDSDFLDMSMGMGRPKTPDAHLVMRKQPQFPALPTNPAGLPFVPFFAGPGLIPTMANSMLFTPPLPEFAKNPYSFPMMAPKQEVVQKVSPKPKHKEEPKEVKSEVLEVVPLPVPTPPAPAKISPVAKPVVVPVVEEAPIKIEDDDEVPPVVEAKKLKEHKKDKKDKIKKKNKKEKIKDKTEKKKLKEAKKEKLKIKKEKKEKKKVPKEVIAAAEAPAPAAIPKILLKVNSPSPRPETPDTMKKLNIKPVIKKEDQSPERKPHQPSEPQRESSPGLAQISALVIGPPKPKLASPVAAPPPPVPEKAEKPAESSPTTPSRPPGRPRIHPVKPKPLPKPKKIEQPPFVKVDAEGNEVWICPACGQQDDGRPMIGCDGCDAWYHWVCVGIQVPPDENENWYCKPCLAKKNEDLQDRKKKRKKKDKGHL